MRKIILLLVFVLPLAACSTKSKLIPMEQFESVTTINGYTIGTVQDTSGYVFDPDEEEFDLAEAMEDSIVKSLQKANIQCEDNGLVINTKIIDYEPGNAFKRWLMPGYGETELKTENEIATVDGVVIARIPIKSSIGFGGAYTIGAWKYVFDNVSEELVKVLKEIMKKQSS